MFLNDEGTLDVIWKCGQHGERGCLAELLALNVRGPEIQTPCIQESPTSQLCLTNAADLLGEKHMGMFCFGFFPLLLLIFQVIVRSLFPL